MKTILSVLVLMLGTVFAANAQTGAWSGELNVQGMKLPLVFHLDDDNPTMDSPMQGAKGIPVQLERDSSGKVVVSIPAIGARYEGQWQGEKIEGSFSQMGMTLPLVLVPGEVKRNRPQTPQPPFPYKTEEVSSTNGTAVLKGTLTLPEGAGRQTPVLIMVSGSGLQDRDETLFEHKPFAVIADAFAKAGIATLRYDDRGFGESTGDIVNMTEEDLKNDALAGITLLRERFDHVGVIGHSEGGSIAIMLASEKKADFIISLAGMVVSGKETLLYQNRVGLASRDYPQEIADRLNVLLGKAFDAVLAGQPAPSAEGLPEELKQGYDAIVSQVRTPYFSSFVAMDLRSRLGDIECPVLAFNGTKDQQVECEPNIEALRNGLKNAKSVRLEKMESVNHLQQTCETGGAEEYMEIEETISPKEIEIMVEWIKSL
ncbi:MAG: alpha/beta hydrolase [Bacteroidales bacterium]|nr:alpha/beta hydrolase [Bacteroidales bacterium]